MPLYLDIHDVGDTTPEEIAKIHLADVETQGKYHVEYRKYWMNQDKGKVFCLVEAPNAEAACRVHREAHGCMAEKIIEVDADMAEGFLGGGDINAAGAAVLPGAGSNTRDPGIRTVIFTDIVGSTSLTQRFGDDVAMEFVRYHDRTVRDALSTCHGREVKHTGDGIMASFVSAAAAVRCASQIQREFAKGTSPREVIGAGAVDALAVVFLQAAEVAVGDGNHLLARRPLRGRNRLEPHVLRLVTGRVQHGRCRRVRRRPA